MVKPYTHEGHADSCRSLFNLAQEKRKRVSGGFKRAGGFRAEVLDAFDHTCTLCGMSQLISEEISLAEAAHIVPHSRRGADIIENAICLCPVCHWAFDKGLVGINQDNVIVVSKMIANESDVSTSLRKLDGRRVVLPESHKVSYTALNWHMRNIFWDLS
jgi:putative restriction endonuclease